MQITGGRAGLPPSSPTGCGALAGRSNEQMAAAIEQGGRNAVARIQEANRTFHHTLLDYSGSPRLRAFLYLYSSAELEQSLHHHQDLTIAAEARDGEAGATCDAASSANVVSPVHVALIPLASRYSRFASLQ